MNYFKWLICWWNKQHVFCKYFDRNGNYRKKCVRCGFEVN